MSKAEMIAIIIGFSLLVAAWCFGTYIMRNDDGDDQQFGM